WNQLGSCTVASPLVSRIATPSYMFLNCELSTAAWDRYLLAGSIGSSIWEIDNPCENVPVTRTLPWKYPAHPTLRPYTPTPPLVFWPFTPTDETLALVP